MTALINRFWRGRLPLWLSYWVFGVATNMILLAVLVRMALFTDPPASATLLWAIYAASLAWFAIVAVATWRAAGRYPSPPVWRFLARAGVLAGALRMAGEAYVLWLIA